MTISQQGTRPKLTLVAKSKPAPSMPADQVAANIRRAESLAVSTQQFFIVWAHRYKPPKYRHATLEAAQDEAERLGAHNPGIEYFVYRCERVKP